MVAFVIVDCPVFVVCAHMTIAHKRLLRSVLDSKAGVSGESRVTHFPNRRDNTMFKHRTHRTTVDATRHEHDTAHQIAHKILSNQSENTEIMWSRQRHLLGTRIWCDRSISMQPAEQFVTYTVSLVDVV